MQEKKDNSTPSVKTTELIRTTKSWDGMELPDYLQGRPELVAMNSEDNCIWEFDAIILHITFCERG